MNVLKIRYRDVGISEVKVDNSFWIHSTRWIVETLNNLFYNGAWLAWCRTSQPWTSRLRDINREIYMMNSRVEVSSWSSITECSRCTRCPSCQLSCTHSRSQTHTHNPCNFGGWLLYHRTQLNGEWKRWRGLHTHNLLTDNMSGNLQGEMIYVGS